jgi:hypothetical protein
MMDKLKTGSGKRLRTEALTETAVPVSYDAATMPGASVLGTDGQIYSSIKVGATYQWSKAPAALSTGEIFLGVIEPRTNYNYALSSGGSSFTPAIQAESGDPDGAAIGIVRYAVDAGSPYVILAKVNSADPLANTAVADGQNAGTILFMGADGTELIPGAGITAVVTGTVESGSVPMQLNLRTRPEGAVTGTPIVGRLRITPDGNVLINNTTGTERISVTGNIQLTSTADSYKVGTDNVVGSRKTGWAAPTGTATRTTFATYAGQDVTDPPTETEVQNIDDHVKVLSERLKALIDDLTSHGLIGPTP